MTLLLICGPQKYTKNFRRRNDLRIGTLKKWLLLALEPFCDVQQLLTCRRETIVYLAKVTSTSPKIVRIGPVEPKL